MEWPENNRINWESCRGEAERDKEHPDELPGKRKHLDRVEEADELEDPVEEWVPEEVHAHQQEGGVDPGANRDAQLEAWEDRPANLEPRDEEAEPGADSGAQARRWENAQHGERTEQDAQPAAAERRRAQTHETPSEPKRQTTPRNKILGIYLKKQEFWLLLSPLIQKHL